MDIFLYKPDAYQIRHCQRIPLPAKELLFILFPTVPKSVELCCVYLDVWVTKGCEIQRARKFQTVCHPAKGGGTRKVSLKPNSYSVNTPIPLSKSNIFHRSSEIVIPSRTADVYFYIPSFPYLRPFSGDGTDSILNTHTPLCGFSTKSTSKNRVIRNEGSLAFSLV